jgi:hypothetical protein
VHSPIPESLSLARPLNHQAAYSYFPSEAEMFVVESDTFFIPKRARYGDESENEKKWIHSHDPEIQALENVSQETCPRFEVRCDVFPQLSPHTAPLDKSPLFEISIGKALDQNIEKATAILESFQSSNQQDVSMNHMMKNAGLTDTKKNRALVNSLVADGRLLVHGRSRSTRYRAAAARHAPTPHADSTVVIAKYSIDI